MDNPNNTFIGIILQGIFYGLYCVIFVLYLRLQHKRKYQSKGLVLCALGANFILCTTYLAVCMTYFLQLLLKSLAACGDSSSSLQATESMTQAINVLYMCTNFISQGILIYRCWILWRRRLVMIVPVSLSLAFLAISLMVLVVMIKTPGQHVPSWWFPAIASILSISLAVNAILTGLIISGVIIFHRRNHFLNTRNSYVQGRGLRYLYLLISAFVESGMITLVAQIVQTALSQIDYQAGFPIVSGIVVQLYGISPTIVLVRVAMGISCDNETSMALPSQAIRFSEFQLNGTTSRTVDVSGNDSMNKSLPSHATQNVSI